ncbi:MAG: DUF262 domain-containing protein [Chloroflexi bacterium]|nr:DUF262 domain-containing protein [Chloroflexota bacterium]
MSKTAFKTNPVALESLLRQCADGTIQLPDFQRSWVWGEDRIMSLIASVSGAFPIGALMTLESKSDSIVFAYRPVEGAPPAAKAMTPEELLLDGQQRMTSLYQACLRRDVVHTITPKNKLVNRWFYIDIQKAIQANADRDEAIFSIPENRCIKTNFDKDILLDLSQSQHEFEKLMFPLNRVFDWDEWQDGFWEYWSPRGDTAKREMFKRFKNEVLQNFKSYQVPVIALAHDTSREAVCLVFEKVNTGGKALDAFELLTAMYAAQGHKLRDDWLGADGKKGFQARLAEFGRAADQQVGVLSKIASTDFLQAVALRHTKEVRADKAARGASENELPAVRATRQSLLHLPLEAYLSYRYEVEDGFKMAVKFLRQQNIYRVIDLPYQTQLVPLAAIFAEIGDKAEHAGNMAKITRWFWCGIFGELYGGAVESRFAKDVVEVPAWLQGGPEPATVSESVFRGDRLLTMRTRLSAAYKGIHALLMREGAKDFRSGQSYDQAVFFDEGVDIHHIFPQKWCEAQKIEIKIYDTVINKTPLSYRTNRIIGGVPPSEYLAKLETGKNGAGGKIEDPPIAPAVLDSYLRSHFISPADLRADNFTSFMAERHKALLTLIGNATGHPVNEVVDVPEEGEELSEEVARDSGISAGSA